MNTVVGFEMNLIDKKVLKKGKKYEAVEPHCKTNKN